MSLRYLFPCTDCEFKFELVSRQAGQELVCPDCGNATQAPKLGTLKKLELAESASEVSDFRANRQNSNTGGWKNILFVSGLALAIIAGVAGFSLYRFAQSKIVEFDVEREIEKFEEWIDENPPTSVLGTYVQMEVGKGLPEWQELPHIGENKQAAILKKFAYGLFGLSGLGLLTLIGSFLIPKRKS